MWYDDGFDPLRGFTRVWPKLWGTVHKRQRQLFLSFLTSERVFVSFSEYMNFTRTQKRSQNVNVNLHRKSSIQNVKVDTCIDRIILGIYTYTHTQNVIQWMGLRCQSLQLVQYFSFLIFSCPILQLWKLNTFYDSFSFSQSSCQVRFIDTHVHYM